MFLKKNPTIHIFNPFLTSSEKILSKIRETFWISPSLSRALLTRRKRLPHSTSFSFIFSFFLFLFSCYLSFSFIFLLFCRTREKCLLPMEILNKKFQFFQTKSDFFPIGKIGIQNVPNPNKFILSEPHMS